MPIGVESPSWKGGKYIDSRGYVHIYDRSRGNIFPYTYEHILQAENLLGKRLPDKAVVHHHSKDQIIICQDQGYHMSLHRRQRALQACGNANWRKCKFCNQWDEPQNLYISPNTWDVYHPQCQYQHYKEGLQ